MKNQLPIEVKVFLLILNAVFVGYDIGAFYGAPKPNPLLLILSVTLTTLLAMLIIYKPNDERK